MQKKDNNKYYIYILECENGILYTGITLDYNRRLDEHMMVNDSKKGAKFTKSHRPIRFVAFWTTRSRSAASKLEIRIKQLDKDKKLKLIEDNSNFKLYFSGILDCRKYRRVRG